jgi:alpha-glucoside transport system permease protein
MTRSPSHLGPSPARSSVGAKTRQGNGRQATWFLAPALIILAGLVVYPIFYTVIRSLFNTSGSFVGLGNYVNLVTDPETYIALRNNAIWILVAPALVTSLGLIFAVMTERIRWGTAFKTIMFMPMAISMLAAGVIFTLVYDAAPERGVLNAALVSVHDMVLGTPAYSGARPRENVMSERSQGFTTRHTYDTDTDALLPLIGLAPDRVPAAAGPAVLPAKPAGGGIRGLVWLDFAPGGGTAPGRVDPSELGLPGITVQALEGNRVVGSATTAADGSFILPSVHGPHLLRLSGKDFQAPFRGLEWLGPGLVTPSIILAFVWMWAGMAMVLIGSGLAAIPRETLEAARVDGANEWQVFRRVTLPLLRPVVAVVLVTLAINVLKIFDLVYVLAPGPVLREANVLAVQMYLTSFGGGKDYGLSSAIAVVLFLLVVPIMITNIRRFRQEQE